MLQHKACLCIYPAHLVFTSPNQRNSIKTLASLLPFTEKKSTRLLALDLLSPVGGHTHLVIAYLYAEIVSSFRSN
jgi:hypothetical protein